MLGKSAIVELLADYNNSGLMASDFATLDPKDRLAIAEKLMQYVMPKMQSTSVDITAEQNTKTIEDMLRDLADDNEAE